MDIHKMPTDNPWLAAEDKVKIKNEAKNKLQKTKDLYFNQAA